MGLIIMIDLVFVVFAIFELFEFCVDLAVGNITKKEALITLGVMLTLIIWIYVL